MSEQVEIISVNADNVTKHGFFCYKSKKKSEGYQRKLAWLNQPFAQLITRQPISPCKTTSAPAGLALFVIPTHPVNAIRAQDGAGNGRLFLPTYYRAVREPRRTTVLPLP